MGKGIIALILEALLFLFFYTHWNPLFEEQREQERCQSVLNSITTRNVKIQTAFVSVQINFYYTDLSHLIKYWFQKTMVMYIDILLIWMIIMK